METALASAGYEDWRKILPIRYVLILCERFGRIIIEGAAKHPNTGEYYVLFQAPNSVIENRAALFPQEFKDWDGSRHG